MEASSDLDWAMEKENLRWRQKIERHRAGWSLDSQVAKGSYECSPTPKCKLADNRELGGECVFLWLYGVLVSSL